MRQTELIYTRNQDGCNHHLQPDGKIGDCEQYSIYHQYKSFLLNPKPIAPKLLLNGQPSNDSLLIQGKPLQEVAVWGKLKNPPLRNPIYYILKRRALNHDYHLHGTALTRPANQFRPREDKASSSPDSDEILFSHTRRRYQIHFLSLFFVFILCIYLYFRYL